VQRRESPEHPLGTDAHLLPPSLVGDEGGPILARFGSTIRVQQRVQPFLELRIGNLTLRVPLFELLKWITLITALCTYDIVTIQMTRPT
jgi:hypothetical protein